MCEREKGEEKTERERERETCSERILHSVLSFKMVHDFPVTKKGQFRVLQHVQTRHLREGPEWNFSMFFYGEKPNTFRLGKGRMNSVPSRVAKSKMSLHPLKKTNKQIHLLDVDPFIELCLFSKKHEKYFAVYNLKAIFNI